MMQSISDLYSQAGLFPFSCQLATTNATCETPAQLGSNPDNTQSDTVDNFAASEELQGVNDVGSGNGQGELCGTIGIPNNTTVDYARSSKPQAGTCSTEVQVGYAKDSVPVVDFQSIDPNAYGAPSGYDAIGSFTSYNSAGTAVVTPFPTAGIGPVAAGWEPGDSDSCVAAGHSGTVCSGTAFTDVDNTGGAGSVAYRLWCQHGPSLTAGDSQITDWGQLTNLSASANGGTAQAVGNGAPIGVPIRIIGVNSGSGTAATFNNFAKSGQGSGNCTGTSNYNEDAASGANPQTSQGPTGNLEIALENDASQIGDFANANWGMNDPADQATDVATSLYYMGFGPYNTNPNASVASLELNSPPSGGLPAAFGASYISANNVSPSIATERSNAFPTSRTLFNIYRTDTVRASTAGFLNWICDTNASLGGQVTKGTDHVDGGNFDTDLTNVIQGQYGFSRLTDATPELVASKQTTANGVVNPNASCDAQETIGASGITVGNPTITLSAPVPATVVPGWKVTIPVGFSIALPANDTIASVSGSTITLAAAPVAGTVGASAPGIVYLPGHPPVLAVDDANS
jgi:hypothetical protein